MASNWDSWLIYSTSLCIIVCMERSLLYSWDEQKRKANIRKHGLDFGDAANVFRGPTFTFEDTRFDYKEQRWITIGLLGQTVVVMVHTESQNEIHLISMRKAQKNEQEIFYKNL